MAASAFSKSSRLARALVVLSPAVTATSTIIGLLKPTDSVFANTTLSKVQLTSLVSASCNFILSD